MEALKIKAPTQKAAPKKEPEEKKEETKKESETAPVNAGTKKWNLQKILWGE